MVIPLSHPVHGTKIAIAEAEAVADEKNGWVRLLPAPPAQETVRDTRRKRKE
jgi:hypothetical protein